MTPQNLYELCFACPDGTIGVAAGFCMAQFDCKTSRDVEYVYRESARLGYSCMRTRGTNQVMVSL